MEYFFRSIIYTNQMIHVHFIQNELLIVKIIAHYCLIWKSFKSVMISSTLTPLSNFANMITVDV